jgi:hypothetical protein
VDFWVVALAILLHGTRMRECPRPFVLVRSRFAPSQTRCHLDNPHTLLASARIRFVFSPRRMILASPATYPSPCALPMYDKHRLGSNGLIWM